jgi:hypothetical protein
MKKSVWKHVPYLLALGGSLCILASAQEGARVKQLNLEQLANQSALIVRARVLETRSEKHPTLPNTDTLLVKVQVLEDLKGTVDPIYSFRIFVFDATDVGKDLGYRPGNQMVLFLPAPSRYGFSSPVGLEQGRFRVDHDTAGNETVVNDLGNVGLFSGMEQRLQSMRGNVPEAARVAALQHRAGPIRYQDLRQLILALSAVQ